MTYHLSFWPTLAKSCDIPAFGLVWVAYFCVAVPIGWVLVWFNAAFWIWADSQLSVVGNRFASGHSFTWAEAAQRVRDQLYENALHRGAPEQASFGGPCVKVKVLFWLDLLYTWVPLSKDALHIFSILSYSYLSIYLSN